MMEINTKTSLNTPTVKVSCSKDQTVLKAIYLPTLEVKEVKVYSLYKNPLFPLKNSEHFKKFFFAMFQGSTDVEYTPEALNLVVGLAELNSQVS